MATSTADSLKTLLQYHTSTDEAVRVLVDMASETERRLSAIEEKIEPISGIAERLKAMDDKLNQMQALEEARQQRARHDAENRPSALLLQVALILAIILMVSPVLISEVRTRLFGDNPLTWLLALIGALALFLIAATVTRRNGTK